MIDIGTLVGRIVLEDDASVSLKTFSSNLDKIGGSMMAAGTTLTVGLTAPLVAAAGASLLFAGNFEASMTRLVSLAGVSQDQLGGVKQHILDLAPAVGIGPQALAEAMMKVSSTVSDTSVALQILDMSAKGSAAGMGDAKDVAGAITAVVNSYGASNITAARAADILTKAVQDGGAEAKELAPTLANIVPIAAQMGVSFEEVGANIATLTKLGVPASEAVTSLTSIMTALLKETKQGGEALASVGLSYDELRKSVKERGLAAAMTDLTVRFGENKTGLTDVFGRIEALKNIMGTAGQQTATYAQEVIRMTDSVGSLDTAFNAMKGTQLQTWGEVSAALQVAAIRFGDALAPAMGAVLELVKPLLGKLTELVSWFTELPKPLQVAAIGFAALLAAIGPVLVITGSLMTAWSTVIPVLVTAVGGTTTLTAAWALLTAPITASGIATGIVTIEMEGATVATNFMTGAVTRLWAVIAAHPIVAVVAAIGALTLAFVKWKGAAAEAELATQTLGAQQDVLNKATKDGFISTTTDKALRYAEAIAFNNESFRKASGGAMSLSMAMAELQGNSGNTHTQIKELNLTVVDLANKGKLSTPVIGQIGAAVKATKIPLEDLPPALRSIVQSLDNASLASKSYVGKTKEAIEAAKKHAEALKGISDQLSGKGLLANANLYVEALKLQGGASTLTNKEQMKLVETYREVVEKYKQIGGVEGAKVVKHFEELLLVVNPLPPALHDTELGMIRWGGVLDKLPGQIDKLPLLTNGAPGLTIMGDQVHTLIPGFVDMHAVMEKVNEGHKIGVDRIKEATPKYVTLKDLFKKTGEEVTESFGVKVYNALGSVDTILSHIPGKFSEAAQVGVRTAQGIMQAWQKGDWIGGIVAGVTGVITIFTKLFTSAEKAVNPIREAYVQAAGGLNELNIKAQEAGVTLDALLSAKNPEQYKSAIDKLNLAFDVHKQKIADANTMIGTMLGLADTLGVQMPDNIRLVIGSLTSMKGITQENLDKLHEMAGTTEVDFKAMQDIAGKYGIDLANLGPAFQSARLHDAAATIINDFDVLTRNGADVGAVLTGMSGSISALVVDSLKFGTTIPENMRPWIQKLSDTGQLIDADGNKITDLSGLKFADPIVTEFQKIVNKIQELIDKIGTTLPGAIAGIPIPAPIDIPVHLHPRWDDAEGGLPPGMATGGRVIQGPWAVSGMGTDTTLTPLTPGEGVVTTQGMNNLGVEGLNAINSGKSSVSDDDVHREIQGLRNDLKNVIAGLPNQMAVAMEDAIVLLPRRTA